MRRRHRLELLMGEPPNITEAIADFADQMGPILDAVAGYRERCLQRGFNETAAELMSIDFHRFVLAGIQHQATKGSR
jgi:hypothetical protein